MEYFSSLPIPIGIVHTLGRRHFLYFGGGIRFQCDTEARQSKLSLLCGLLNKRQFQSPYRSQLRINGQPH